MSLPAGLKWRYDKINNRWHVDTDDGRRVVEHGMLDAYAVHVDAHDEWNVALRLCIVKNESAKGIAEASSRTRRDRPSPATLMAATLTLGFLLGPSE